MIASYAFYSDYSAGFYDICRSMEGIFFSKFTATGKVIEN